MTGSTQLRVYLDLRRKGQSTAAAAQTAGMPIGEARLWDAEEAKGELGWVQPPASLASLHVHVREGDVSAEGEETMFEPDGKVTVSVDGGPEVDITDKLKNAGKERGNTSESAERLRSLIARVESVQEELDELNADKASIFKEAKDFGLDTSIMKIVLKRRKLGLDTANEQDLLVKAYEDAMHLQIELPLTRH